MYWNSKTISNFFIVLAAFVTSILHAQVSGKVLDSHGTPISFASISVLDSSMATVADEAGVFYLPIPPDVSHKIFIHQTGYNPKVIQLDAGSTNLDVELSEVTLIDKERYATDQAATNLATDIMRKAIASKSTHNNSIEKYTLDYYARGSIQGVAHPKKVLGYRIEQLDPSLKVDSLRNKYMYLSETMSEVHIESPHKVKEIVTANTSTGSQNGIGFDTYWSSNFNFYQDIALKDWKLVSPLSTYGFAYYTYKVEEIFYDEWSEKNIYKIEVTPRRPNAPVIEGSIYLVDETWEIFAIDAHVNGKNVELPKVNELQIRQHFLYNKKDQTWVKNHQFIDFNGSILVFKYKGNYIYNYQNITPKNTFSKNTFSDEVITFTPHSRDKDSTFWNSQRPIPLSSIEQEDRRVNDAYEKIKNTRVYQDSIDRIHNKFNLFKLIQGYKYRISHKNATYTYNGLLSTFAFNPVQGFNVTTGLWYTKNHPTKERYYSFGGLVNYGIAENKPRISGFYTHLFNKVDYAKLQITGGSTVHQFGEDFPIKKIINSIAASWFGENFAKYYQKDFLRAQYEQEWFNGFWGKIDFEYANRLPLFNHTERSPFIKDKLFSSNNPLNPNDFTSAGFEQNHIFKLKINAVINFKQEYIRYPEKKVNLADNTLPVLMLNYEKGFGSTVDSYNYDLIGASIKYQSSIGVIGKFGLFSNAGYFMNADNIAFMDYKHFYGNETFVGTTKDYLQNFNLLPYYNRSTNTSFVENHIEHNFKGFLTNKIPLFDKLQWHVVIGAHTLFVHNNKPYYETSIGFDNFGFGKFRPFRIDYVRSFEGGKQHGGIVLGIKFLNGMQ